MTAKTAGSVWLAPYEGDKGALWPVILCDDDVPPKIFMESRKNGFHQPAILLGKRIWIWVALNRLEPIDPAKDYTDGKGFENNDIQASDTPQEQLEKLRRVAFTVDVKDPRSPAFYQNYIVQRSAERKLEAVMRAKANKRRRSRDDDDDDDIKIIGSRRRSSGDSRSPTADTLPTPKSNVKKRKRSTTSNEQKDFEEEPVIRQSNHLDDPFTMTEDEKRERNWKAVQNNPPTDDMCTIFVGAEQTPFLIPMKAIDLCDFLCDRVFFNEEVKSHIDLAHDTDVNAKEFAEIWHFMSRGDFTPRTVVNRAKRECLEGVVLVEEKDVAATKIAKVYVTASKLRFGVLQQLCLDKLKLLYPLSSHALLTVLMIFTKADVYLSAAEVDQEGREWLMDHVVEQYWTLSKNEHMTFTRLMQTHCDITHAILAKLGQNPHMAHGTD